MSIKLIFIAILIVPYLRLLFPIAYIINPTLLEELFLPVFNFFLNSNFLSDRIFVRRYLFEYLWCFPLFFIFLFHLLFSFFSGRMIIWFYYDYAYGVRIENMGRKDISFLDTSPAYKFFSLVGTSFFYEGSLFGRFFGLTDATLFKRGDMYVVPMIKCYYLFIKEIHFFLFFFIFVGFFYLSRPYFHYLEDIKSFFLYMDLFYIFLIVLSTFGFFNLVLFFQLYIINFYFLFLCRKAFFSFLGGFFKFMASCYRGTSFVFNTPLWSPQIYLFFTGVFGIKWNFSFFKNAKRLPGYLVFYTFAVSLFLRFQFFLFFYLVGVYGFLYGFLLFFFHYTCRHFKIQIRNLIRPFLRHHLVVIAIFVSVLLSRDNTSQAMYTSKYTGKSILEIYSDLSQQRRINPWKYGPVDFNLDPGEAITGPKLNTFAKVYMGKTSFTSHGELCMTRSILNQAAMLLPSNSSNLEICDYRDLLLAQNIYMRILVEAAEERSIIKLKNYQLQHLGLKRVALGGMAAASASVASSLFNNKSSGSVVASAIDAARKAIPNSIS
jgi:hypothetical protein